MTFAYSDIPLEQFTLKDVIENSPQEIPRNYALRALGLKDDASRADILKAYRALALKYHTDKLEQAGKSSQEVATARGLFDKVQIAYNALK